MTVVQRGNWPGWPGGVTIELADDAAAALLTAVRDYQNVAHVDLKGDYLVLPVGGKRTPAETVEMQYAFDHKDAALLAKYNMDPASKARPSSTSPHLTGYCMDISGNAFLVWLVANGAHYGLRRTLVALNDLRHFQYFPGTATAALDSTSLDNAQEDTMPHPAGIVYEIVNGGLTGVKIVAGPKFTVLYDTAVPFFVGFLNHSGIELLPDFRGFDQTVPIGGDNAELLSRLYGPTLQGGTVAALWAAAKAAQLPVSYPTTSAPATPTSIDYAALAKAVNDDAAKRLAN